MIDGKADKPEVITAETTGDCLTEIIARSLSALVKSIFNVAKLRCSSKGSSLISKRNKKNSYAGHFHVSIFTQMHLWRILYGMNGWANVYSHESAPPPMTKSGWIKDDI